MDKAVSSIAAVGIPGLVLIIAVSASGYVGAAALTTALAALGGPFGMLGGVGMLLIVSVVVKAISEFGVDSVFQAVVGQLRNKARLKRVFWRRLNITQFLNRSKTI